MNIFHLIKHVIIFRLEWESSVKRGVTVFRRLEEERLTQLTSVSRLFLSIMINNRPKMISLTERLREPVELCDVNRDMEVRSVEGHYAFKYFLKIIVPTMKPLLLHHQIIFFS